MERMSWEILLLLLLTLWSQHPPASPSRPDMSASGAEHDELFGPGLSESTLEREARRHVSSSTEDLADLFREERAVARRIAAEEERRKKSASACDGNNRYSMKKIAPWYRYSHATVCERKFVLLSQQQLC